MRRDQVFAAHRHWRRPRIEWYGGGHFTFNWEPAVSSFVSTIVKSTLVAESGQAAA